MNKTAVAYRCQYLLLIVFYLSASQPAFSQDCKTQAANKPAVSFRFPDIYNAAVPSEQKPSSWNITKIKPTLAKAESWVKKLLTGFTGAKLAYSNDYFLDYSLGGYTHEFYKATDFKGWYNSKMRFYAYYCYDNNDRIYTEEESGSYINVVFNNVFASSLCTDVGVFTINGKPVFTILEKRHTEGRTDYYELRAKNNVNDPSPSKHDIIIIRNSDKPVFITVTRKEYLQQMLKDIETSSANDSKLFKQTYDLNVKQFEEEMKAYKLDKKYTPENEAKRRKWFEEDQEKLKKIMSKVDPAAAASREVIVQYLQRSDEWLNRSVKQFYSFSYTANGLKDYFEKLDTYLLSSEDETRTQVVALNPAYFSKTPGTDVPQLIMVFLPKGEYPHMKKVAALVKQPGALAPLEVILNPGKSPAPETVTPEFTSTYTTKYLSKLTALTPLTLPAGMKPSAVAAAQTNNNNTPATKFSFEIPALSPKLSQLPNLLTAENYKTYLQQLFTTISTAVKPEVKKKADASINTKKIQQPEEMGNTALNAWLQNAPELSLYLYSKAALADPADALTANNFAAFLIMGGAPEKSIPLLEYWNKIKPGEATIFSNLGNAYYRLGDTDKALQYLLQCVQKDTLNPTANKILCMLYLKKGDVKKAADHGTKSLTASHDEQVIKILRQLNNKTKAGEIMSRLPAKEFPLLKRTRLPAMPSSLDDMERFAIDLEAEKKSLALTIAAIEAKMPKVNDDVKQKVLMTSLTKGMSPLRIKAQYIILDGMQTYQKESTEEAEVFKYNLKKLSGPYTIKVKAISKKYAGQLNKLEGGEAGGEDEIASLELARCKEINAETEKYLSGLAPLVNEYARRHEFISRKFYRDYANWTPYWMPETTISFPSIERDYLRDISGILGEYKMVSKSNCEAFEPLPKKEGKLKEWEDEYCANFKGKIAIGPGKFFFTCNSWGFDGGEGFVGDIEFKYRNDGSFENFTLSAGLGANWHLGKEGVINTEIGVSVKDFIKIGPDDVTGKWVIKDAGIKAELAGEASIGNASVEEKVIEVSAAVNAGFEAGGIVPGIFGWK